MRILNYTLLIAYLVIVALPSKAQQLPYYTQNKSNSFMINPAITGTKRLVDARLNYRAQWVGYDDAPRTMTFSLHSRFLKGKVGAGLYMMQDNIGPMKQFKIGGTAAFHLRFPDCELSAGIGGNYGKLTLIGDKLFLHNTQDPSINQFITDKTWVGDLNAGVYLYNDRFHVGMSGYQVLQSTAEFYKSDTTKKGLFKYATHVNFSLGYNYAQNPDFIWESTLFATYVNGAPFNLDYTLRLHVREQFFGGISLRLRDAVAIHLGVSFLEAFQISYSYDLLISKFRNQSSGSHEVMLVFSSNIFNKRHGRISDKFLRQRYGYLF